MQDLRTFFKTSEVLKILGIEKCDLYTVMRPVRSGGKLLPPIFTPEVKSKITTNWIFTQRDIIKLRRYFNALKEYQAARRELRQTGKPPDLSWMRDKEEEEIAP